jgi:hypothetical protein
MVDRVTQDARPYWVGVSQLGNMHNTKWVDGKGLAGHGEMSQIEDESREGRQ